MRTLLDCAVQTAVHEIANERRKTEDFLAGIQGYVLVERSNIAFVVKMTGGTITIYETPPI